MDLDRPRAARQGFLKGMAMPLSPAGMAARAGAV